MPCSVAGCGCTFTTADFSAGLFILNDGSIVPNCICTHPVGAAASLGPPAVPHPVNCHTAAVVPAPIVAPAREEEKWWAKCINVNPDHAHIADAVPPPRNDHINFGAGLHHANDAEFPFLRVERQLYIRSCWYFFIDFILRHFSQFDVLQTQAGGTRWVRNRRVQQLVITGTPGIGKSCFGLYLLYRLAHWFHEKVGNTANFALRTLNIIYTNHPNDNDIQYYHFCADLPLVDANGQALIMGTQNAAAAIQWTVRWVKNIKAEIYEQILYNPNSFLISDGGLNSGPDHFCFGLWLTSAKKSSISAVCRMPRGCLKALYQPPWNLDELQRVRRLMYNGNFTEDFVARMMDYCGGIIRFVLAEPSALITMMEPGTLPALPTSNVLPDFITSLDVAINQSKLPDIERFLGSKVSTVPEDISSKILILVPIQTDTTGANINTAYRNVRVEFASRYISIGVAKALMKDSRQGLLRFLAAGQNNDLTKVVCGNLFEGYAHNLMRELPALTFRRRLLIPAGQQNPLTGNYQFSSAALMLRNPVPTSRPETVFTRDTQIGLVDEEEYIRPCHSSFPAVDSMMRLAGTTAVPHQLFQMTIATDHPIKLSGINRIDGNNALGQHGTHHYDLNFVVPNDKFDAYTTQPYHNAADQIANLPPGLTVTQYVVEVNLSMVDDAPPAAVQRGRGRGRGRAAGGAAVGGGRGGHRGRGAPIGGGGRAGGGNKRKTTDY